MALLFGSLTNESSSFTAIWLPRISSTLVLDDDDEDDDDIVKNAAS